MLRAAQNGMLQDMRNPGTVCGRRTETDIKHLVLIIVLEQCNPCACLLMAQQVTLGIQFPDPLPFSAVP